jgi:hypothetical protein
LNSLKLATQNRPAGNPQTFNRSSVGYFLQCKKKSMIHDERDYWIWNEI